MTLKLNKSFFSRNKSREKQIGAIFNKTSNGISNLMPLVVPLFIAPTLITTSYFSKELILMLANIFLCLGYLSNFIYRIYAKEISRLELLTAAVLFVSIVPLCYLLYPMITTFSFIHVLFIVNQTAAAVNLFFLVKDAIIPPFKRILEKIGHLIGIDIADHYYSKPPFNLAEDRFAIDRLMTNVYGYSSASPEFNEEKIVSFNYLLKKLCSYINKYDESFLGYLINKESIINLESQINSLTQGNPDSSFTFIRKKISYKTTKIQLLESAQKEVYEALHNPSLNFKQTLRFFTYDDNKKLLSERKKVLCKGVQCLQKEIIRQQEKVSSLKACLPSEGSNSAPENLSLSL